MGRCCGTLTGCSVIITILVVVSGYFAYNYMVTTGTEYLANSIERDSEIMVNMVFEKDDREEIMTATTALTDKLRLGEISITDLIHIMTSQEENQIEVKAYLLGFKKQYLTTNEKLTDVPASQAAKVVDQILLAVTNDNLQSDQIASITELITYRHEEKHSTSIGYTTSKGHGKNKRSSKPYESTTIYTETLLKPDLNSEQISDIIAELQKLVEENNLPVPDESIDFSAQLKKEILQVNSNIENFLREDKQ